MGRLEHAVKCFRISVHATCAPQHQPQGMRGPGGRPARIRFALVTNFSVDLWGAGIGWCETGRVRPAPKKRWAPALSRPAGPVPELLAEKCTSFQLSLEKGPAKAPAAATLRPLHRVLRRGIGEHSQVPLSVRRRSRPRSASVREHPFREGRLLQLLGKLRYGLSLRAFRFPSALLAIRRPSRLSSR